MKLLLQLQQLLAGKRCPPPPVLAATAPRTAARSGPAAGGTVQVRAVIQTPSAAVPILFVAHGGEVVIRAVVQVTVHGESLVFSAALVLLGVVFTVRSDWEETHTNTHVINTKPTGKS